MVVSLRAIVLALLMGAGAALGFVATAHPVAAQSLEQADIGLIDMRHIEQNAQAWKDLRVKVKQRFESFAQKREDIRQREQLLREEQQELSQQQAILSTEAFEQRKKNFERKIQQLRLEFKQMTESLEKVHRAGEKQIIKELQQVVLEIAEERNLRLIINYTKSDGTIVMWRGEQDVAEFAITEEALRRLDSRLKTVSLPEGG